MIVFKRLVIVILHLIFSVTMVYAAITRVPISSPDLSLLPQARLVGPVNRNEKINFTVWLKLRNQKQLEQLLTDLYDPSSQHYHKFLTKHEFDLQYAPSINSLNAVQHYFSTRGMQANINNNHVSVVATANQIEQVFQVQINHYRYEQQTFYANNTSPLLESDLAPYVSTITGLNNMPIFKPLFRMSPKKVQIDDQTSLINQDHDVINKTNVALGSLPPTDLSINSMTAAHLRTAYQLASIQPINGTPINGAGQTIVIIDACSGDNYAVLQSDANAFSLSNGLPLLTINNFSVIGQAGGAPPTVGCNSGWSVEIALDIQAAHAMAPNANIVLVLAKSNGFPDLQLADNYAVQQNIGSTISHSWGSPEWGETAFTPIFQQAAAQGQSMNFATGDCGDQINCDGKISVIYPASSTYVTAVGGTSLFVDANWNYSFETGWGDYYNNLVTPQTFYAGGGGGVSVYYPAQPAQAIAIGSFIAGGYTGKVSDHKCNNLHVCRALPDIAMLADPYTGLFIYNTLSCHGFCGVGGTSVAAPLFTGVMALVNQARTVLAGGIQNNMGLVTPYLYKNNSKLLMTQALNVITPPHLNIPHATPVLLYPNAFSYNKDNIFNIDSSLTIIENQFWNDVVGVGSPNIPKFVATLATL